MEMMVAIAVFSIVMVAASGALLNVIDANNKAKSIKTAVNNITLALEAISKDMRMGSNYACGASETIDSKDCKTGGKIISFKSSKSGRPFTYYKFKNGQILSCVSPSNPDGTPSDTSGTSCKGEYSAITSSEVLLTNVTFWLIGVKDSTNAIGAGKTQPRVIITISGEAGTKEKTKTKFDLQTSVSQVSRPATSTAIYR